MPRDLKRYDEPGHTHFWTISCYRRLTFFWNDGLKQVLVDGLQRLQRQFGVCLIGYVVMPEHVHVLVYPHRRGCDEPTPISTLLHALKRHVAYYGKEALRTYWRQHGSLWSEPLNCRARGDPSVSRWATFMLSLRDEGRPKVPRTRQMGTSG